METFRDPAITKFGQSYERATLLEHLKKASKRPLVGPCCTFPPLFWPNRELMPYCSTNGTPSPGNP